MYSQVGGVSRMVMRWCREWSHSFTLEGTPKRRDVEELLAVTMRNRAMEADIQLGVNDKAARNPSPPPAFYIFLLPFLQISLAFDAKREKVLEAIDLVPGCGVCTYLVCIYMAHNKDIGIQTHWQKTMLHSS